MRKNLSIMLLAALPLFAFGQSRSNAKTAKSSVFPNHKKSTNIANQAILKNNLATYCMPDLDCSDGDLITNVTIGTINNTTGCSSAGYGDHTDKQTTVVPGQSYPISVTVGDGWFERVSAWVDFDNNGTFETGEFIGEIGDGADMEVTTLSGNIPIPATLAPGSYRLRVMVAAVGSSNPAESDACSDEAGYGEVEDYTLVVAPSGCLTSPNGQYPSATYTPVCDASVKNITSAGYAGEYSKVNLVGGTPYTFSVSKAGYFITISNEAGTTALASGTNSVMYTPTANEVIRFYSHTDSACGSGTSATIHTRSVKCGLPPVEPDYGCDQTYTGVPDTAHNMTKNLATANYMVANDFFVPMESGSYKLQTVNFDVVTQAAAGISDVTSYDVKILADSGSKTPGSTVLKTLTGVAATNVTTLPGTFASLPTYRITIDLGNFELPVNSTADTRYWVAVTATSASSTSVYWIGSIYNEGWVTASDYQSSDEGVTWVQGASTSAPGVHYEGMMMIDADCATAAVSEVNSKAVSYYPNPVKDYLTINSGKTIKTVHVYNIAGQKMNVASKLIDGKINMSSLTAGTYIISTILEDGKNESFKVIKK